MTSFTCIASAQVPEDSGKVSIWLPEQSWLWVPEDVHHICTHSSQVSSKIFCGWGRLKRSRYKAYHIYSFCFTINTDIKTKMLTFFLYVHVHFPPLLEHWAGAESNNNNNKNKINKRTNKQNPNPKQQQQQITPLQENNNNNKRPKQQQQIKQKKPRQINKKTKIKICSGEESFPPFFLFLTYLYCLSVKILVCWFLFLTYRQRIESERFIESTWNSRHQSKSHHVI